MFKKILLLFFLVFLSFDASAKSKTNIFAYPREAPSSPIFNRYGQPFTLKDFAGDFLIVIFWSKTCIPCLRELDDLSNFVKKTKNNLIKVILVSPHEDWLFENEQQALLQKYGGQNLDVYTDKKSALTTDFGIFTSPHTVLINADSMEIGRIRGSLDWDDDDVIEHIYEIKAQN